MSGASTNLGANSSYIGLGNVDIIVNQSANLLTDETDGDNGYVNTRNGQVSTHGNVSVTYSFTPVVVPVPTAVWLFGSTLGLMGVMRRKVPA